MTKKQLLFLLEVSVVVNLATGLRVFVDDGWRQFFDLLNLVLAGLSAWAWVHRHNQD